MFQQILVPLDGSARAEQALPVAARLARAAQGTITLVQAVNPPSKFMEGVGTIVLPDILDENVPAANPSLKQMAGKLLSRKDVFHVFFLPSFLYSNILGCGEHSAHRTGSPVSGPGRARDRNLSRSGLHLPRFRWRCLQWATRECFSPHKRLPVEPQALFLLAGSARTPLIPCPPGQVVWQGTMPPVPPVKQVQALPLFVWLVRSSAVTARQRVDSAARSHR
jgi:hypothetical protein